jgi:hypothetical protein
MSVSVGDRVRSFDFSTSPGGRDLDGDRACFVEGRVESLVTVEGCLRYRILVERDVFGGEDSTTRVGRYTHPPVNGTPRLIGGASVTNFVESL